MPRYGNCLHRTTSFSYDVDGLSVARCNPLLILNYNFYFTTKIHHARTDRDKDRQGKWLATVI
jgi:hypothetical protein